MALINYKKDLVEDLGLHLVSYQVGGSGARSVVPFKVVHKKILWYEHYVLSFGIL